ncbi:MAG: glycosyltransferase [Hyphomicrobiales bacterium]
MLFAGHKEGEDLAKAYASADVFVFPSLTDTFGLVLLEALLLRRAGRRLSGQRSSVLTDPACGVISDDLRAAALRRAQARPRGGAERHALDFSWENSAREFVENVLAAHNLGLPERRRFCRVGGAGGLRKRKRLDRGRSSRLFIMRQFETLWGTCVRRDG